MKVTKDFDLKEFIDELTYKRFGDQSIWFLDNRLISLAQFVHSYFDHMVIINNWFWGGDRQYSGFRPRYCEVGAEYSQHRFGRAMDILVKGISPEEVRAEIKKNKSLFLQAGLRAVEKDTPTWTHLDLRNSSNGLLWVNG